MKLQTYILAMTCIGFQSQAIELSENIDIYGKAEVALSHSDTGEMKRVNKGSSIRSVFSRIGIKGHYALAEDVDLLFTYEWEVKGFDKDNKDKPFAARNTYIGLGSTFSSLLLGRNDTRFKKTEASVDAFKEREALIK